MTDDRIDELRNILTQVASADLRIDISELCDMAHQLKRMQELVKKANEREIDMSWRLNPERMGR